MQEIQIITVSQSPAEIFKNAKEFFLSGEADPLLLFRNMTSAEKAISELKKDPEVREYALAELSKYGKETDLYGCKMEQKESGVKYDFSVCDDDEWNQADRDEKDAKERKKAREEILKKIRAKTSLLDEETGQLLKAPIRTSTTTIQITFKKK